MAALSRTEEGLLEAAWSALAPPPEYRLLRPVEVGMTLLRGRIGGIGQPFNFGEATITRAAVALATGEQGFAYLLGRHPRRAELAAVFHALLQREESRDRVEAHVIRPVEAAYAAAVSADRAAIAATRVDFSTVVRGDG
jgi:alpha-D-ribose 1-methylphosphonate 5-triphosphate synthase subunit PhnG